MITTIITAAAVYIATSIDNLIILLVFFAHKKDNPTVMRIVGGKVLGTSVLIAVSLLSAFGLRVIPEQWIIGLLGFVPLGLGLKVLFEQDGEESLEKIYSAANKKHGNLLVAMTIITIASGGDNLGVYIPLFAAISQAGLVVTVLVFYMGVALLCYIGYRLAKLQQLGGTIEKYERIIVPVVFIGLGIMILVENGTIAEIIEILM
ncbi:CadD family cadmium resistance transporter [Dethiobacter alkaliphilus]|uniref:CadD family cadmium resistance transporter n=1 Tax=Dethiobacter alkaliphilus TaxID=427926 RepID=UPI002227892A|nr:CadD family cadmium resistance transporter [Dethiobacter alkaliphilus]MCW3490665.1 CadD family cadmium resistance transporter [Dethiobacter alkaliphilus]